MYIYFLILFYDNGTRGTPANHTEEVNYTWKIKCGRLTFSYVGETQIQDLPSQNMLISPLNHPNMIRVEYFDNTWGCW